MKGAETAVATASTNDNKFYRGIELLVEQLAHYHLKDLLQALEERVADAGSFRMANDLFFLTQGIQRLDPLTLENLCDGFASAWTGWIAAKNKAQAAQEAHDRRMDGLLLKWETSVAEVKAVIERASDLLATEKHERVESLFPGLDQRYGLFKGGVLALAHQALASPEVFVTHRSAWDEALARLWTDLERLYVDGALPADFSCGSLRRCEADLHTLLEDYLEACRPLESAVTDCQAAEMILAREKAALYEFLRQLPESAKLALVRTPWLPAAAPPVAGTGSARRTEA